MILSWFKKRIPSSPNCRDFKSRSRTCRVVGFCCSRTPGRNNSYFNLYPNKLFNTSKRLQNRYSGDNRKKLHQIKVTKSHLIGLPLHCCAIFCDTPHVLYVRVQAVLNCCLQLFS